MLSDLSVSARHQRRLRAKLQVCFRRRVKSVLGPHHSGELMRRPRPKSNAGGAPRSHSPLFTSGWLLTRLRARLRSSHRSADMRTHVLTLPRRSEVRCAAGADVQHFFFFSGGFGAAVSLW